MGSIPRSVAQREQKVNKVFVCQRRTARPPPIAPARVRRAVAHYLPNLERAGTRSEGAHLVPASHTRRHASTCQMGLTAQIFMRTEPEDSASSRNWKSLPAYRRRQRSKTHLANRRRKRLLQSRVSAERQRLSVRERAPWGVLLDRIGDRRARPRSRRTARRAGTTAAM